MTKRKKPLFLTGSSGKLGKAFLNALKEKEVFEKYHIVEYTSKDDLLNLPRLYEKMPEKAIIIHLAAKIEGDEKKAYDENIMFTKNLVKVAIEKNAEKIIFSSSCGVYGSRKGVVSETTEPAPETKYEESKLMSEKIIINSKIPYTILRFPLLYPSKHIEKMINAIKKYRLLFRNSYWKMLSYEDGGRALVFVLENDVEGTYNVVEEKGFYMEELYKTLGVDPVKVPSFFANVFSFFFPNVLKKEWVKRLLRDRNYEGKKFYSLGYKPKNFFLDYIKSKNTKPTIKNIR